METPLCGEVLVPSVVPDVGVSGPCCSHLPCGVLPHAPLRLAGSFDLGTPAYDIDVFRASDGQQFVAVVSPQGSALVSLIAVTDRSTGVVVPPSRWHVNRTILTPPSWGDTTGCNRIRVRGGHAFVSCFNVLKPSGIVAVFSLQTGAFVRHFPFADVQPTGMLVVGRALFVAGGRDVMVFNITDPATTSVVTTCGGACKQALLGPGQNAHSLAHAVINGTRVLVISGQVDNGLGAVAVVDDRVLRLMAHTDDTFPADENTLCDPVP